MTKAIIPQPNSQRNPQSRMESWLVMYDLPTESPKHEFYRRLNEIIAHGDNRISQSVYIFSGGGAKQRAYTVAALAEQFGAARTGEPGGPQVFPLADDPQYFDNLVHARAVASKLCEPRRTKLARKENRDVQTLWRRENGNSDSDGLWIDVRDLKKIRIESEA